MASNTASSGSKKETVTKEWLQSVLQKYYGLHNTQTKSSVEVLEWEEQPSSGALSGYLSEQRRITVVYQTEDNVHKAHLFLKQPPLDEFMRDILIKQKFDMREIRFYTEIKPELDEVEKECLSEGDLSQPWTPTFYYGTYSAGCDFTLVLENLAPRGYKLLDYSKGLSYDQAKSAMIAISHFHAAAIALEQRGTPLNHKFPFLWSIDDFADCYSSLVKTHMHHTQDLFKTRGDRETTWQAIQKFTTEKNVREVLRQALIPSGKLNTLLHNDYWSNNLLVKTEGEKITSCVIDWQTLGYGTPALDVSLFISSSLNPEVRRKHKQQLHTDYWSALTSRLARLNIPISSLNYTRADFDTDFKKADVVAALVLLGATDVTVGFPETSHRSVENLTDFFNGVL